MDDKEYVESTMAEIEERWGSRAARYPSDVTPLMKYVLVANDPVPLRAMLKMSEYKDTLNKQDSKGMTALMYAVDRELVDIAKTLITAGADKTLKNASGETAADIAKALDDEVEDKPDLVMTVSGGRRRKSTRRRKSKKTTRKQRTKPLR